MKSTFYKLSKPIVLLIAVLCLCMAVIALLGNLGEIELGLLLNNSQLPFALALQIIASSLFILVWKLIVLKQSGIGLTLIESASHIGVTLLGKYIPGKVWGLLGRTVLLKKHGLQLSSAANLLLLDQVLTFSSGIIISAILLAILYLQLWSIGIAIAAVLSLAILLKSYEVIAGLLFRTLKKALRKQGEMVEKSNIEPVNNRGFYLAQGLYLAHWCITGFALSLFVYPLIADNFINTLLLITAAIPLAMLSGFLVLWAPGGIGIREGVIVAVLGLQLPLDIALLIAVTYRLICILIDLVIGIAAAVYFSRNNTSFF